MKRLTEYLLLTVLALSLLACGGGTSGGETGSQKGKVTGTLIDSSGSPVPGAMVLINNTPLTTGDAGEFTLSLNAGDYTVIAYVNGTVVYSGSITIISGNPLELGQLSTEVAYYVAPQTWYHDADGDNYSSSFDGTIIVDNFRPDGGYQLASELFGTGNDCNDRNNSINPGVSELFNSQDDNCDGFTDEGWATYYQDGDGDGYATGLTQNATSKPAGYVLVTSLASTSSIDCNDANAGVNPGATEVCNLIDDNCSGAADEGVTSDYYPDGDSDGYGLSSEVIAACSKPAGYSTNGGDCDDVNGNINPGAAELFNSLDDNCNEAVDEGWATYYQDGDGDGYTTGLTQNATSKPDGYVPIASLVNTSSIDCDDASAAVSPGAAEVCNLIDDNCSGAVDEGVTTTFFLDGDQDGYGLSTGTVAACSKPAGYAQIGGDCNNTDGTIFPGAAEIADDGVDQNCDGADLRTWYQDADRDGYTTGLKQTATSQPAGHVLLAALINTTSIDCNDASSAVNPGKTEVCNLIDDNCSGAVDEGVTSTFYLDGDSDGYGLLSDTVAACSRPAGYSLNGNDCDDANANVHPGAAELFNSIDDDCDEAVDEGWTTYYQDGDGDRYTTGLTRVATSKPAGYVLITSLVNTTSIDCNDASSAVNPGKTEVCNLIDDNCSGVADEGVTSTFYLDGDSDGFGLLPDTIAACTKPSGYALFGGDCDDANGAINPGATEIPDDGVDQNCDSMDLRTWYRDADGDSYGDPGTPSFANLQPGGFVENTEDCDDTRDYINLDAVEIFDEVDNNCDGQVDEGTTAPDVAQWQTFQGNAAHTGYVPLTLDPANFKYRWTWQDARSASTTPVTAASGSVFVSSGYSASGGKQTCALNALTGNIRWSQDLGGVDSIDPPAYAHGMVYVQTGGHGNSFLWGFDASDGTKLFKSSYGNQWSTYYAPTPFGRNVYLAGGYYGGSYGFHGDNGSSLWFADLNQYDEFTPAVDADYVYAYTGDYSPQLTVLNRKSGSLAFSIPDPLFDWNGWSMDSAPVLGELGNVLAINGGRLISFDLSNWNIGWTITGAFRGQPSLSRGAIYCNTDSGAVQVRSEADGVLLWQWVPTSGQASGPMIVTENLLLVSTSTAVHAVDLNTHLSVWSYPAAGRLALSDEGTLLVSTTGGKVVAIDVLGDTDGDGINDRAERITYHTDPNLSDTDGDGVDDYWELGHGQNPLVADAGGDVDSDNFTSLEEYLAGTDPNNPDSDGDGLTDGEEVKTWSTNPLSLDTDGDQMEDLWETTFGLAPTDAGDADLDLDSDTFTNQMESFSGSDPGDNTSVPVAGPWQTFQGDASHTGFVPLILDPANFAHKWTTVIAGGPTLNPAAVSGGRVFTSVSLYSSTTKPLYSLDGSTGNILWQHEFGNISSVDPPAVAGDTVYVQTGGNTNSFLWGFAADTGTPLIKTPYGNQSSKYYAPTPYLGNIYMGGGTYGGAYAMDGTTGSQLWFTSLAQDDLFTPAVKNDHVYVFSGDSLRDFDRATGARLGSIYYKTGSDNQTPTLNIYDQAFARVSGNLVCFDLKAENVAWTDGPGYIGQPVVRGKTVYAIQSGAVRAKSADEGGPLWLWNPPALETLSGNMVVTGNLLFAATNKAVYAIDTNTHLTVWSYPKTGHISIGEDASLLIATSAGEVISIGLK
jgi:hypothetical protein